MYLQDGKIVGNATACPALAHASAEERRQMKEQYGLDCDCRGKENAAATAIARSAATIAIHCGARIASLAE